jgi:methylated-DNA-protein-cysteine methyltransferase-like protein
MSSLPDDHDLPWHRVINARGEISARSGGPAFERLQRALLESEGVAFGTGGRVDLERFGWPSRRKLPVTVAMLPVNMY